MSADDDLPSGTKALFALGTSTDMFARRYLC